ncbi:MAG TPA: pantoate--beta-alanine ligase [Armatimonadota bacterium]|jgi:pantoate--beta-alanine ligase
MRVFDDVSKAREWSLAERCAGRRVALVPTMGALHNGHLALVELARSLADSVVVSIFVNPTQFGPNEDYQRYPRTVDADIAALEEAGVAAVFLPRAETMYPDGFRTIVEVEGISDVLEGAIRPGHFRGVTTVVAKLLNVVPAQFAVFGRKDYQQLIIVRRMAEDLNLGVEIVERLTVREADGLAMSSRNRYLSAEERASALALSRALEAVRSEVRGGEYDQTELETAAWSILDAEAGVVPDYAVVLDPATLKPLKPDWQRAVCLVAGRLGRTRLIDNSVFGRDGREEDS